MDRFYSGYVRKEVVKTIKPKMLVIFNDSICQIDDDNQLIDTVSCNVVGIADDHVAELYKLVVKSTSQVWDKTQAKLSEKTFTFSLKNSQWEHSMRNGEVETDKEVWFRIKEYPGNQPGKQKLLAQIVPKDKVTQHEDEKLH